MDQFANLAKQEIRVMLEQLVSRVGEFELVGKPEYRPGGIHIMTSYGIKDLPIRLTRRCRNS